MGSQWWEDAPLTVNVSYVAPQMPTKLPTNQLPKVCIYCISALAGTAAQWSLTGGGTQMSSSAMWAHIGF